MSYEGYNMEDGLILNQSSVERGLQRSFYYKLHNTSEIKYPGGLQDRIAFPNKDIKGYRLEEDYRFLEDDGIVYVGQYVETGDVLIGKISPPRFIEEIEGFGQMINLNIDSSIALKEDENGVVSSVFIVENSVRDEKQTYLQQEAFFVLLIQHLLVYHHQNSQL
jgi:DNA-directed RNA polymerase beta subunit